MPHHPPHPRAGFTLVELLMVIAIIGILVGLLLPAVLMGLRAARKRAIAIEVQTIANAVDAYKNKFNDYPPDGSNFDIFKRHFRKLFPQIAEAEFDAVVLIANVNNGGPGVMDPPEVIVFCLGGYSTDPVHPFTGVGGPISKVPGTSPVVYQYNTDRNEPLYDFKQSQLSVVEESGVTVSTDEVDYKLPGIADKMPVYRQPGLKTPVVYFESRTYGFTAGGSYFFNLYGSADIGYARPYKSDKTNTNVAKSVTNADIYFKYMNDRGFQLVGAGLDDNFGGNSLPLLYSYPSGDSIDFRTLPSTFPPVGTFSRYKDTDGMNAQLDNVANFADGPLEDGLAN